ncbi:MAG: heme-degrading domain-containing protein [Pseudomonadota bacterium]
MEKPDDMLALIARQEQTLQFDSFDNRTALALGLTLVELARADRLPVTIDITRDGQVLFHHALDGAANDQANWIRRKSNLVKLTGHSSFYTHTEVKSQGGDIDAIPTLDPIDYAAHGGAFPLTVKGVGMVGTITVSGLPGADDHALVVRALASHLKRDVAL